MQLLLSAGLFLILFSCASPEPHYYRLVPLEGTAIDMQPIVTEVHRPALATYLDRPEMVETFGYKVKRDENRQWAEPLDTMIERVLAADLAQRLPQSSIFAESAHVSLSAQYHLDIDIRQFDPDKDGHAQLVVHAMITDRNHSAVASLPPMTLQADAASTGNAMAKIMSELIAQLADKIALELKTVSDMHRDRTIQPPDAV